MTTKPLSKPVHKKDTLLKRVLKAILVNITSNPRVHEPLIRFICHHYRHYTFQNLLNTNTELTIEETLRYCQITSRTEALIPKYLKAISSNLHNTNISQNTLDLLLHASGTTFSYSQEGEDIVIRRLLDTTKPGFYVDIGAHHPIRFSNTYSLYRSGWRGINVDATPGSMQPFDTLRPSDINIECAISNSCDPIPFYIFKEGALNTFDHTLAEQYIQRGYPLAEIRDIAPRPLAVLLNEHLPKNQTIDIMNIDVEGQEMEVLKSNDWNLYKPRTIAIELLETPLTRLDAHPVTDFLKRQGYTPAAKLFNTTIFNR